METDWAGRKIAARDRRAFELRGGADLGPAKHLAGPTHQPLRDTLYMAGAYYFTHVGAALGIHAASVTW
jgi:hypothetical protein